ncbi:MAG: hypothetical protein II943_03625 [Victivallales bacterium]|nr:hypothetical protein [Victivallales bacterium]
MEKSQTAATESDIGFGIGVAEIDPLATMVGIADFRVICHNPRALWFNVLDVHFLRGTVTCTAEFDHSPALCTLPGLPGNSRLPPNIMVARVLERRAKAINYRSFKLYDIPTRLSYHTPRVALTLLDILSRLTDYIKDGCSFATLPWDFHFYDAFLYCVERIATHWHDQLEYIIDSAKGHWETPEEELAAIRERLHLFTAAALDSAAAVSMPPLLDLAAVASIPPPRFFHPGKSSSGVNLAELEIPK